ncbi:hypothetical protein KI688_009398 [Linnemannia hyalina]|uniref:Thiamine-binding protein domain-containing protein n=1 Tax=Linnemannia hyalina TaxID=64524 RepID=A0A9P7XZP9_9FUNG|nr:hypothetical protein KI688_009398 [Linnemannia hyalina]
MYKPEQQLHPLDHKEEQKTISSTLGEKISQLGEKLSGTTLGYDNSSKEISTDTTSTHGLPSKEEVTVRCLVDFAIYPMGTTASFQKHIDEVEKVLKRCATVSLSFFLSRSLFLSLCSGIDYKVHAQCTTMEGEMGAIMYAIKSCHEALHAMGCPRIASNVRFDTSAENYRQFPPERAKEE